MANNSQKTPLSRSVLATAEKKAADAVQLLGKGLPCEVVSVDGWIVTVKFEVNSVWTLPRMTIPVASSLYDYLPLKPGDAGVAVSATARLGGISGLGGGVANLSLAANLATLYFVPIGNVGFSPAPPTPGYRVVQGTDGVLVQSIDGSVSIKLDQASGKVEVTGELWINGHKYLNHEHGGVQSGPPTTYSGGVHDP